MLNFMMQLEHSAKSSQSAQLTYKVLEIIDSYMNSESNNLLWKKKHKWKYGLE